MEWIQETLHWLDLLTLCPSVLPVAWTTYCAEPISTRSMERTTLWSYMTTTTTLSGDRRSALLLEVLSTKWVNFFSVYCGDRGLFTWRLKNDSWIEIGLRYCYNFYRTQCSCGKVMFSQASVILFTRGVWQTPPGQTPPWADTPRQTPPWAETTPGQTSPLGRHSLADTPPPEMATPTDGTHPTGMYSCCKWVIFVNNKLKINFYWYKWVRAMLVLLKLCGAPEN